MEVNTRRQANRPLTGSVEVEEVVVKVPPRPAAEGGEGLRPDGQLSLPLQISPFILSTVMSITAAMRTEAEERQQEHPSEAADLWAVSDLYNRNFWFLGVEEATEVTESFREAAFCSAGESFSAQIKVPEPQPLAPTPAWV